MFDDKIDEIIKEKFTIYNLSLVNSLNISIVS